MRVNGDISDIFFNMDHGRDEDTGERPNLADNAQLLTKGLERLGVSAPTVGDLIQDFYNRI